MIHKLKIEKKKKRTQKMPTHLCAHYANVFPTSLPSARSSLSFEAIRRTMLCLILPNKDDEPPGLAFSSMLVLVLALAKTGSLHASEIQINTTSRRRSWVTDCPAEVATRCCYRPCSSSYLASSSSFSHRPC